MAFKERAVRAKLLAYRKPSRRAGGADTPSWRDFFAVHPAADVFPLMSPDELRKLAADIDQNSLKVPIQTRSVAGEKRPYVIDGRNRLDAMESLGWQIVSDEGEWMGVLACPPGTRPKIEHLTGRTHAQVAAEVIGLNIRRRHLSQQAQVELIAKALKAGRTDSAKLAVSVEAKQPVRVTGGKFAGSTKGDTGKVIETAKAVGISKRTVERVLAKAKPTKPRKPKPPVNRLAPEYVSARFAQFLNHWPSRAHQRAVRKMLREEIL